MGGRKGILFLAIFVISWSCMNGREMEMSNGIVRQVNNPYSSSTSRISGRAVTGERLCTLCKEFTAQAIAFIGENKTEDQIIDKFHQACSYFYSFQQECIALVDYYAPFLFDEIQTEPPENICKMLNLCNDTMSFSLKYLDSCKICHRAVVEILIKLKDPDSQLDIIETLLHGCKLLHNHKDECKKLVFEYGPLLLTNAEQFLVTNDVCTSIHACKAPAHTIATIEFSEARIM